jgi:hypothetical protein
MSLVEVAGGTQTAVIDTEHELVTDTTGKTYVLKVDLSNLANGDIVEFRIYEKVRAGSAERLADYALYANAQNELIVRSVPVPANIHIRCTLKQTSGVGRDFEWALVSLD